MSKPGSPTPAAAAPPKSHPVAARAQALGATLAQRKAAREAREQKAIQVAENKSLDPAKTAAK